MTAGLLKEASTGWLDEELLVQVVRMAFHVERD
jgi:hypothetical protein